MNGPPHLGPGLSALLDGELSAEDERAARSHLATCMDCSQELAMIAAARAWVRGLPGVEPPAGYVDHLVRQGRAGPWPMGLALPGRRWGVGVAVAAVVGALGLAATGPTEGPTVSPPVAQLVEAHAAGASVDGDPLRHLAPAGVPVSFRP